MRDIGDFAGPARGRPDRGGDPARDQRRAQARGERGERPQARPAVLARAGREKTLRQMANASLGRLISPRRVPAMAMSECVFVLLASSSASPSRGSISIASARCGRGPESTAGRRGSIASWPAAGQES